MGDSVCEALEHAKDPVVKAKIGDFRKEKLYNPSCVNFGLDYAL